MAKAASTQTDTVSFDNEAFSVYSSPHGDQSIGSMRTMSPVARRKQMTPETPLRPTKKYTEPSTLRTISPLPAVKSQPRLYHSWQQRESRHMTPLIVPMAPLAWRPLPVSPSLTNLAQLYRYRVQKRLQSTR